MIDQMMAQGTPIEEADRIEEIASVLSVGELLAIIVEYVYDIDAGRKWHGKTEVEQGTQDGKEVAMSTLLRRFWYAAKKKRGE